MNARPEWVRRQMPDVENELEQIAAPWMGRNISLERRDGSAGGIDPMIDSVQAEIERLETLARQKQNEIVQIKWFASKLGAAE